MFTRGKALGAGSIEQARLCYRFVRADLEPAGGYRFLDSATRFGITHVSSNTRLRVLSSNAKTAFGIVGCPLLVADEPGSWETVGGELLHDALQTAQGKPGSPLRVVYIGTLAPARGGWWRELVGDGSNGSTFVQSLQGDPGKWDRWPEIRRCNPLTAISAAFRAKLLEERDKARRDTRKKARFLSYRLNVPSADESTVLLTVDDWDRSCGRPLAGPFGRPVVGIDLGGGRAWSAAVALWESGRCEAVAVAPGTPGLDGQERRDRVPRGTYQRLAAAGTLTTDGDRRVPRVESLMARVMAWNPATITCDFFRVAELLDAVGGKVRIVGRRTRWSESAEDIRAARSMAQDGPLSVAPGARALLTASLAAAVVRNDEDGSMRMVKRGRDNCGRDDVAHALKMAAGTWSRLRRAVLERDRYRCTKCGKAGRLEVHHLRPVHQGGTDTRDNLVTRCRTCHLAEHRRVSAERQAWQRLMRERGA